MHTPLTVLDSCVANVTPLMDVPAPSPLGRGYGGGVCLSPIHIYQTFNYKTIPLRGSRDPPPTSIRILGVGQWDNGAASDDDRRRNKNPDRR